MPQYANLPFPLGKTYHAATSALDDKYYDSTQGDYVGSPCEGIEGTLVTVRGPKQSALSGTRDISKRGAYDTTWIAVRNRTAITLLPGMAVRWKAGLEGKQVDGYALRVANTGPGKVAGVVDPFLKSTGVYPGDVFWIQVGGPCLCIQTAEAAAGVSHIVYGDHLVAATGANSTGAATTGCTTEGRLEKQYTTMNSTAVTLAAFAAQIQNVVGIAMSSCTSQQSTNSAFLVNLNLGQGW